MWGVKILAPLALILSLAAPVPAAKPLQMSVYATAGGVRRYLSTPEGREEAARRFKKLHITGIFLEGRRGGEYVPPDQLRSNRDFFHAQGFRVLGGIATVPGKQWGVRQKGPYSWLNFQDEKTQRDISQFFRENAAIFDQIIIDDFYCTEDESPESVKARGNRSWGQYRRDLLASLIEPMILRPAREVRPDIKIILKYPQWYDRFDLFGYDPARESPLFNRIWVGTEVRNPETKRMGYVQPMDGFVNYRWIRDISGPKTFGAWFDHIECTAQNFIDQAWQSVLAGADELTLFQLGDVMEGHPGHALLVRDWDALDHLHQAIASMPTGGVPYYKPVNGDGTDNLWLMDNLGMIGIPVLPVASYPATAKAVILGSQASGDARLLSKINTQLKTGATVVITPALLGRLGAAGARLTGAKVAAAGDPGHASQVNGVELTRPLEVDLSLQAPPATVKMWAVSGGRKIPYLVSRRVGKGTVITWNVRTFSDASYAGTDERLLAPALLGLPVLPQPVADAIREPILKALNIQLSVPSGVAFYEFGTRRCFYNFLDHPVEAKLNGASISIPANGFRWAD